MARRARGAGAVFQRANGRWEAQLRIGPDRRQALVDGPGSARQNASHPDPP